jgi:hypothetical protein
MDPREDIGLVAELVGMTSGALKKIDGEIVSSSANLQKSAEQWNPAGVLKEHAMQVMNSPQTQAAPLPPPSPGIPEEVIQQMESPPTIPMVTHTPASVPVHIPDPNVDKRLTDIEHKLDSILAKLDDITAMDKKLNSFVDRGLRDNVKQITLKLDGNTSTK